MIIGYHQTEDATLAEIQRRQLEKAGCENIYSGQRKLESIFRNLGLTLRKGDTFIVPTLEYLGSDFTSQLEIYERLKMEGIALRILALGIETDLTTAVGKMLFDTFGVIAQYERNVTEERELIAAKSAPLIAKRRARPCAA